MLLKTPTGCIERHFSGARFSVASDSGNTNKPNKKLDALSPAANQKGARGSISPMNPPISEPHAPPATERRRDETEPRGSLLGF